MAKREVPDRNRVTFGPVSVDALHLQRDLDELTYQSTRTREQTEQVATEFEQFADANVPVAPSAAAFYATISTFNTSTNDGTMVRTSTNQTLSYRNGTSSTLQSGDTVAAVQDEDTETYVVIAIIQRLSPYTPLPQEYLRVAGYPADGMLIETGIGDGTNGVYDLPVIYDKDGALGLGAQTLVSVNGSVSTSMRVHARCAATGLTYDLGNMPGTTPTSSSASNVYPMFLVRCGKYIAATFSVYGDISTDERKVFVWDVVNGWRPWLAPAGPVEFIAQATVNNNEEYLLVTYDEDNYIVLRLVDLVAVDSGVIPGSSASRIAYGAGEFAWSNAGHTGTYNATGELTWSSLPRHSLLAPNSILQGYYRCSVHPLTGEFFRARQSGGKWMLTRFSFDSALATSVDIIGDGTVAEEVPLDVIVRACTDGTVLVAAKMRQGFRAIPSYVSAASVSSNVATLSTTVDLLACGLIAGDTIVVENIGAPFDGVYAIQGITNVNVSYALTAPDQGPFDLTTSNPPAVVSGYMNPATNSTPDEEWPVIYTTDFGSTSILFTDFTPYVGSASDPVSWDIPTSTARPGTATGFMSTNVFVGIATDGAAKVFVFGAGDAPASTYGPGGDWCIIDAYDTL